VGFLTGGQIPPHIKGTFRLVTFHKPHIVPVTILDLPSNFLSTPFGQALRPTIDAMFRPPGAAPAPAMPPAQPVSAALNSVVAQAASKETASSTITAPLQISTNPSSLQSILSRHRATAVFFTSATCPPCRVIEPVFEDLAYGKASEGVAFVKVDLGVGMGQDVARIYNVRATPTFIFFVEGQKVHVSPHISLEVMLKDDAQIAEVQGADVPEVKSTVDLMIFQAYPRTSCLAFDPLNSKYKCTLAHAHTQLDLPAVRSMSLNPILYTQVPNIKAALEKLNTLIEASPTVLDKPSLKSAMANSFGIYFNQKDAPSLLPQCIGATQTATQQLAASDLFPLADFWRVALLDSKVTSPLLSSREPFDSLLTKLLQVFDDPTSSPSNPRNFIVTVLRMLSNVFSSLPMATYVLSTNLRDPVTRTLVQSLLHPDAAVRTAAAGLAFNIAAFYQGPLMEYHRNGLRGSAAPDENVDGDWQVELVSALVEALRNEVQSEEVGKAFKISRSSIGLTNGCSASFNGCIGALTPSCVVVPGSASATS
jgi:desumoylating isopeptidase 1